MEPAVLQARGEYEAASLMYQKLVESKDSTEPEARPEDSSLSPILQFMAEQALICYANLGDWTVAAQLFAVP